MAVLFIAVVVIVAVGLFFLLNNNKVSNNAVSENSEVIPQASTPAPAESTTQPVTSDETKNNSSSTLKTYVSANSGISFSYPASWIFSEINDAGFVVISGIKSSYSPYPLIYVTPYDKMFNCTGVYCFKDLNDASLQLKFTQITTTKVGGYNAIKGLIDATLQDWAMYVVQISDGGVNIMFDNSAQLSPDVNEIISSLSFK